MLLPWLARSARQTIEAPVSGRTANHFARFLRTLRKRVGQKIMFFNVTNTLQQLTGLSIAATKVPKVNLKRSLLEYTKAPNEMAEEVRNKSEFMKQRTSSQMFDMMSDIDDIILKPNKYQKIKAFADQHSYFLQTATQNIVDVIVWSGAYDKAISDNKTEKQAVREGDRAVRLTQGSFSPEDASRIEGGSAFVRMFTQFTSYFNMQANLLGSEFVKVVREDGYSTKAAPQLFYIYMMGLMIPALVADAIYQVMSGDDIDDDDDGYMDDFFAWFFGSQFKNATGLVPIAGQLGNAALNFSNDKAYDDRISASPVISTLEQAFKGTLQSPFKDTTTPTDIKSMGTALSLIVGIPLTPISNAIAYQTAVNQGKARPDNVIDYTRGLVTGKAGNQ